MISRTAEKALIRLASQFPIIGITGPRQSGKTTLAQMTFPNKKYVSFDDKETRELAKANPRDFLLAYSEGAIIDEAQKVPDIFDALKFAVDNSEHIPGKYILTGSSQFKLKENMTDSLAGRVGMLKLLPFTISEIKDISKDCDGYDVALKGFYPPLYDKNKHFIPEDWFDNYIDTYLDLDVKEQINPKNLQTFKKFIQICALYSGQMVNMESISTAAGVSAVTVKSWLSVLESSYIIHFLEPDFNNLGKKLVKTPKLYFVDTGLLCYLLRLENKSELLLSRYKGSVVETMAVAELLKNKTNQGKKPNLTFFRDQKGFEIDTIADWKHSYAIEIKSDRESDKKQAANIKKYIELRGENTKGAVFYFGDSTMDINGIKYVSWHDWSSFASEQA